MNSMVGFALVAAVSFGLLFVVLASPSKRAKGCAAPDNAQRLDRFRGRLDEHIGLDSEDYLSQFARGVRAHARLVAGMRPRMLAHQAPVPAGPVRVRYTGPKPRGRTVVAQRPLPFAQR